MWLHETLRVRRSDEPGNGCWTVAGLRRRFFSKKPEAALCSSLFESPAAPGVSWVLHYRLVRRTRPILQIERFEGLSEAQQACVAKGGALERLPIPSEIAVLSADRGELRAFLEKSGASSIAAETPKRPGLNRCRESLRC